MEYREYLKADHWRDFRKRMIHRSGGVCRKCGFKPKDPMSLNVHHKSYDRLGAETTDDVEVLCYRCHKKLHEDKRKAESWLAELEYRRWLLSKPSALDKFLRPYSS